MAEPTLKDVLGAIVTLTAAVGRLEKGQAALEKGQAALEKDLNAFRTETRDRFDALDEQLGTIRGIVARTRDDARDVRDDVDAMHKGLVRAKIPGVPKDLPSQVRSKGERPSKPAKRAARRR